MEHADEGNVGLLALEVPVGGLEVRSDTTTRLSSAHVSVLATINDTAGTEIERFSEDVMRRWPAGSSAATGLRSFLSNAVLRPRRACMSLRPRFLTTTAAKPRPNGRLSRFPIPGPCPS